MYRHCIFCSSDLGVNDSLEEFPVGRALAFDSWRGRLWAICPVCQRWNLAPIEMRWEAVERAEKVFRATSLRVQAERIGLAQLRDGTRLVRVGDAVPGELAAWRYGRELLRRRRRYWMEVGFSAIATATFGVPAFWGASRRKEVIGQIPASASPTGRDLLIKRLHLDGAEFRSGFGEAAASSGGGAGVGGVGGVAAGVAAGVGAGAGAGVGAGGGAADVNGGVSDGGLILELPRRGVLFRRFPGLVLQGQSARAVLERALVGINHRGASPRALERALGLLEGSGSAEAYVGRLGLAAGRSGTSGDGAGAAEGGNAGAVAGDGGERGVVVMRIRERLGSGYWRCEWGGPGGSAEALRNDSGSARALALEMALHEAAERRALEGELAELESRWREAEEIARIADAL